MKINYPDGLEAKVLLTIVVFFIFSIACSAFAQEQTPSPPKTIQKSEETLRSEAVTQAQPKYPPLARAARVSGTVTVEVTIDESGKVVLTRALSGHALLKDPAINAARSWTFKPATLDGAPVRVTGVLSFNFDLNTYVPEPLTPEEEQKLRRAQQAADRFIDRWHETLDMNVLFDEMYVSNPKQRRRNVYFFYGVYKFISGSGYNPEVDKNVNEAVMREGFMAFWNMWYMTTEYNLAFRTPDNERREFPADVLAAFKEVRNIKLSKKYIRLAPVRSFIAKATAASSLLRKYFSPEVFRNAQYNSNSNKHWAAENKYSTPFEIEHGFQEYGVGTELEVYRLRRGIFEFYFVEEGGELKVLTLGFEL